MWALYSTLYVLSLFNSEEALAQTPCIPKGKDVTSYRLAIPSAVSDSLTEGGYTTAKLEFALPLKLPDGAHWMLPDGKKKSLGANSTSIPVGTFDSGEKKIPSAIYLILPSSSRITVDPSISIDLKVEMTKPGGLNYHKAPGLKSFKGSEAVTKSSLTSTLVRQTLPICDDPPVSKDCVECKAAEERSPTTPTTEVFTKDTSSHLNDPRSAEVQTPSVPSLEIDPNLKPCGDCANITNEIFLSSFAPLIPALKDLRKAVTQTGKCPEDKEAIQKFLNAYVAKLPSKTRSKTRTEMQAALTGLFDFTASRTANKAGLYNPSPLKQARYEGAKFIECGWNAHAEWLFTIQTSYQKGSLITNAGEVTNREQYIEDAKLPGTYTLIRNNKGMVSYRNGGAVGDSRFYELAPGVLMLWIFNKQERIYAASILFQQ